MTIFVFKIFKISSSYKFYKILQLFPTFLNSSIISTNSSKDNWHLLDLDLLLGDIVLKNMDISYDELLRLFCHSERCALLLNRYFLEILRLL